MFALTFWIIGYDRADSNITLLHRMGIGIVISMLWILVAGLVEEKRRLSSIIHGKPISVSWLVLIGVVEAFNAILWLLLFPCCRHGSIAFGVFSCVRPSLQVCCNWLPIFTKASFNDGLVYRLSADLLDC
ncbi:hypothetical protein ACLOJK_004033 [Asimina triloba]